MALRLAAMGQRHYARGFEVQVHEDVLDRPLRWRRPRMIFVNSMSDLFHEDVPVAFIRRVFVVMRVAQWHHYQILTKRSQRLMELSPSLPWMPHMWAGVSVECERYVWRIEHLRRTGAHVKFLSLEPLLGPLHALPLDGISWVIVGGESGPGARPMEPRWVYDIRDQCVAAGVPFFFKQWGGPRRRAGGCELDGRIWRQWPAVAPLAPAAARY